MASDNVPRHQKLCGYVTFVVAIALASPVVYRDGYGAAPLGFAALLIVIAYALISGQLFRGFKLDIAKGSAGVDFDRPDPIQPKIISEDEIKEKEKFADKIKVDNKLPGQDAPQFRAVSPGAMDDLLIRPSAHHMTPMYLLDNMFRIIDWNEAFTIAFDRTMEGRKGLSVLEWTYFLDNYEAVLSHGVETFSDANRLPVIDVETIEYSSLRYGKLTATKRAYQIPDDAGDCLAWLVTLDLKFAEPTQQTAYHRDLIRYLGLDLMWSEYSISYDHLLNNTRVYPELLDSLIGAHNGVPAIPQEARILDLGAGTGNLVHKLITTGRDRVIFAVENNRVMLQLLRAKCHKFLRNDPLGGGVITIKQDITSLFGLEDDYFDYVTMNNVLYAVEDADACLIEACRVLKPGGQLRLSGPRKDTKLDVLFDRIESDLKESNKFSTLKNEFQHVQQINQLRLNPWLYRWTTKDVEGMLLKAGFSKILYSSDQYYAGQSMLICAVK